MYSRSTGFTPESMSGEYLRAKYAAKTAARTDRRREVFALQPPKEESEPPQTALVPQDTEQKGLSDDLIIPALLAFLLFSDRDGGNMDFILTAALLFIQFG